MHLFRLATTAGPAKELRVFRLQGEIRRRHRELWERVTRRLWRAEPGAMAWRAAGQLVLAAGYVAGVLIVVNDAISGHRRRAMMREMPLLLVLDEPTSALDAEAEHALFERYAEGAHRVGEATGGVTVLDSHRFSTVRMADLIQVVADGRIVEAGPHSTLMPNRGAVRGAVRTAGQRVRVARGGSWGLTGELTP